MTTMTRPCGEDLDLVPLGEACPRCGGGRRMSALSGTAAIASAVTVVISGSVGHQKFPTWHALWAQINRRVHRLERIYTGAQGIDNTGELEDEVDALLLCIANLRDWMIADPIVGKSLKEQIRDLTALQGSLGLCREYANTFKHHTYNPSKDVRRYARLHESTSGPSGVAVSLRYWKEDGAGEDQSVDALKFALDCIAEWRNFLAAHGIEDP